jgi:histidinol-phosphate aminotransferase
MSFNDPLLRKTVGEFAPYKLGTSVAQAQLRYGLDRFIKLSQNENPLGTSPAAIAAIRAITAYSDYEDDPLPVRERLAQRYGLGPEQVILGHGSNELMAIAYTAFADPGDDVVMATPTFGLYRKDADIAGARSIQVGLRDDGVHDLDAMLAAVTPKTKLVWVCDPNNPTGTSVDRQALARFAQGLPAHVLLVVDQAYCEFMERERIDAAWLMERHARTLVLRTASKIYGLAAARFGYGYSSVEIIAWMNRVRVPFNVTRPAVAAVIAALDDQEFIERSLENNAIGKAYLCGEFARLGLHAYPTEANFIALAVPTQAEVAYEGLLSKGVIVRSGDGLNMPGRLRVSIGLPEENRAFIAALESLLAAWR